MIDPVTCRTEGEPPWAHYLLKYCTSNLNARSSGEAVRNSDRIFEMDTFGQHNRFAGCVVRSVIFVPFTNG
jgi:hypothetical protein